MALAIAAVFTSCEEEENLPTAGFTYAPETVVQYDVVVFTNTSTDADTYEWDFGGGLTSTEENPSVQFLTAGDVVVSLTVSNDDGSKTTEQTITVNAPDNHYMLGTDKLAITTEIFWYQSPRGGDPYLRLLTVVDGQDNPDLLKLYPNKGLDELPQTYTWSADGAAGTYDHGYTANLLVMDYDWTAIGKTGSNDLLIEEVDTDIYKVTGTMILSVGSYDYSTGVFTETSEKTLTLSYIGVITPLGK